MDASHTMRNHCVAATRRDATRRQATRWKLSFHRSFPNHWHRCSTSRSRCLRLLFISVPLFPDKRVPRFLLLSSLISTALHPFPPSPPSPRLFVSRLAFIYLDDTADRKLPCWSTPASRFVISRSLSHLAAPNHACSRTLPETRRFHLWTSQLAIIRLFRRPVNRKPSLRIDPKRTMLPLHISFRPALFEPH